MKNKPPICKLKGTPVKIVAKKIIGLNNRRLNQNVISFRGPGSSATVSSSSSAHTSGLRLENASMPVRSEMRAAIWPSTSSSLPPPSSSRGTSGPSGQLGQVSSAVWISRWMCVKSFTLTTSWALSDSRMRRWVSCAAFMASSWLRTDSPFASSRELSSSRIYTKHTSTNQSKTAASTH